MVAMLALTALTSRSVKARNSLLLVASYYFYGSWDYRFLSLIVISTLVDFTCGLLLDVKAVSEQPIERTRRDKWIVCASVTTNLCILGFFKYFDFFASGASDLLNAFGMSAHPATLKIILPVGISFYTFQTMSYTIDLYRRRVTTERNLLTFAVYVSFFPQLVAGPIERAARFLPQIRSPERMTWVRLWTGMFLMAWGMFKKVVIADQIAVVADNVFAAEQLTGLDVLLGLYAFAVQIYCDFSGYTDIARGAARCMGYDLMQNFDLPYFATNPADFWRRWHISLSTWLRDYLYIPLGGNRKGKARTYVNLMVTMLLGGLWHGTAWNFVAWGAYQGGLLCIHRAMRSSLERWVSIRTKAGEHAWSWVRQFLFFHCVCYGWLLFRAESFSQIVDMTKALLLTLGRMPIVVVDKLPLVLLACLSLFGAVQFMQWRRNDTMFVLRLPAPVRSLVYAAGILGFIFFGKYTSESFIYFQF